MIYAQFYELDRTNSLVEACGDRQVIKLDGRQSKSSWCSVAEDVARKRGYLAWSIHKGGSFTESRKVVDIQLVK